MDLHIKPVIWHIITIPDNFRRALNFRKRTEHGIDILCSSQFRNVVDHRGPAINGDSSFDSASMTLFNQLIKKLHQFLSGHFHSSSPRGMITLYHAKNSSGGVADR